MSYWGYISRQDNSHGSNDLLDYLTGEDGDPDNDGPMVGITTTST